MKKFVCPACGEEAFTPLQKAFAGQMNQKGTPCPHCGVKCVNGMQSRIFRTILSSLLLAFNVWNYLAVDDAAVGSIRILASIIAYFVIATIVDAFLFPMAKSIRIDR